MYAPLIAALFVFGGLLTYTRVERRWRRKWWTFAHQVDPSEAAPYRLDGGPAPTRAVLRRTRAPKLIRRTALWSIYMGQMAVPGGLLGLIGVPFWGLGLASIPGMILAVRIWRLGYAMLRRDPEAAAEARKLHDFAFVLNVVAMAIGAMLSVGAWPLTVVLWVYGAVSLAHAKAMERCAKVLENEALYDAQQDQREAEAEPVVLRAVA